MQARAWRKQSLSTSISNIPAERKVLPKPQPAVPTIHGWGVVSAGDTSPTCVLHVTTNTARETAPFRELPALSWANANWGNCIRPSQISHATSIGHSPPQCLP